MLYNGINTNTQYDVESCGYFTVKERTMIILHSQRTDAKRDVQHVSTGHPELLGVTT